MIAIAACELFLVAGCKPAISSVRPSSGPGSGGTSVTLTGSGLSNGVTVKFGAAPATVISVTPGGSQPDVAIVTSPPGTGQVAVTATTANGTSDVSAATQFFYRTPLFGFADLHAHPASHLAFGSDSNGRDGIFWGSPGMDLNTAPNTLPTDMPACAPDVHSGFTLDFVQHKTRGQVIAGIDAMTGAPHAASGAPTFTNWPSALSVEHQQMHVLAIRRAYDGGLRLLVASVTDNQLLNLLWYNTISACPNGVPPPRSALELASAMKQLQFIQTLAQNNAGWMQVVKSSVEARQAIAANKLAIVLGTEMDSLNYAQLMMLQAAGVRSVIPVHLADNSFGGSAIYNDQFNTNTKFLNGKFFSVGFDPMLTFRLGPPQELQCSAGSYASPATPSPMPPETVNYTQGGSAGHVNTRGLTDKDHLLDLMAAGLIIDVAHMSAAAVKGAIDLAKLHNYPIMDSHTALRKDTAVASSERDLLVSDAANIAQLGGMIGLGTANNTGPDPIEQWLKDYLVALAAMGGGGVGIGTDANGLSPQMVANPSKIQIPYPITIASKFNPSAPALAQFGLGARLFDFATDGIANYGMLPDFLQAVSVHPDFGQSAPNPAAMQALTAIYHSAEDFVEMWERVESAAATMACQQPSLFCGGVCKNTSTDSANCGVCENVCPAGTTCTNGGCFSSPQACTGGTQQQPYPWCGQTSPTVIECTCPVAGQQCKPRCSGGLCSVDLFCQ